MTPAIRALPKNQVHFWFTRLAEEDPRIPGLLPLLSRAETERAERFHLERDRSGFIISHAILRLLLSAYLARKPEEISFEIGPYGKPSLSPSCADSSLQFNMSHADGMAVFAMTRNRHVGIDVEHVDRHIKDRDEIVASFFSARELAIYRSLPEEDRVEGFFNGWTRKESFIKAKGEGLTCPLDSFDVTLRPGDPARLLSVQGGSAEDWSMVSLELFGNYRVAITAEASWQLTDMGEVVDAPRSNGVKST